MKDLERRVIMYKPSNSLLQIQCNQDIILTTTGIIVMHLISGTPLLPYVACTESKVPKSKCVIGKA